MSRQLSLTALAALAAAALAVVLLQTARRTAPAAVGKPGTPAKAATGATRPAPAPPPGVFSGPEEMPGTGWLYRLTAERVMGSGFSATAVFPARDDARAHKALDSALAAARSLEKKISTYEESSEIRRLSRLEAGRSMDVSPETFAALEISVELWRRSGGVFDCTVGPLMKLYKYTGREERLPTEAEIRAARAKVGTDKLLLDPESRAVAFKVPGMEVDLGAVGQGLGTDVACAALKAGGAVEVLVDLGGEVRALGPKRLGQPWKVAIQHPRAERGVTMADIELSGNAVSTSGDYEKFFKKGGRRASHIIDPHTGQPLVGGAVSVTIIAPTCVLADGLATAASVLGPVEGMKLIESYRAEGLAVEALIIEETADGRLIPHLSPGLKGKLELKLDLSR